MAEERPEVTDNGKMWAMIAYAGFFIGFPTGFIPLVLREDDYSVQHGRHATAVWLAFFVTFVVSFAVMFPLAFCTFGLANFVIIPLLFLLTLWPLAVSVHGLILTVNGQWDEPIGVFGLGDRLFGSIEAKPKAALSDVPDLADAQEVGDPVPLDPAEADALAEMEETFPDQG